MTSKEKLSGIEEDSSSCREVNRKTLLLGECKSAWMLGKVVGTSKLLMPRPMVSLFVSHYLGR